MSQIDKVIYIPLLFWFWVLFLCFYLLILSYFVTNFFYTFKVRQSFFYNLIIKSRDSLIMLDNLINYGFKFLLKNKLLNNYLNCLNKVWSLFNIIKVLV